MDKRGVEWVWGPNPKTIVQTIRHHFWPDDYNLQLIQMVQSETSFDIVEQARVLDEELPFEFVEGDEAGEEAS